jgi:PadR family transcriptional regulator, regulatory protein AphA
MVKRNRTRYVLLGLLAQEPKSGYRLKQEIEGIIGHFWSESYGQIYPELKRMTEEGLVVRTVEQRGRRKRFVYGIAPAGRTALGAWLEEPAEPETVRNELLLKLFFGRNSTPEMLLGHVRAFRERAEQLLSMLRSVEAQLGSLDEAPADTLYWRLTIRSGEATAKARLDWADGTLDTLARLRDDSPLPLEPGDEGCRMPDQRTAPR